MLRSARLAADVPRVTSFFPEPPPAPIETADDRAALPEPFVPGGRLPREDHAHNAFLNAGPPVHIDAHPVSRWQSSATTFGPVGRIVVSLVMVATGAGIVMLGMAAPIAIFMWWFVVMPKVMFDVWRPARRP